MDTKRSVASDLPSVKKYMLHNLAGDSVEFKMIERSIRSKNSICVAPEAFDKALFRVRQGIEFLRQRTAKVD